MLLTQLSYFITFGCEGNGPSFEGKPNPTQLQTKYGLQVGVTFFAAQNHINYLLK